MIEYDIFDSNDPENPTIEDEFKMDLTVTLGYGSVTEMLENIDSNEYSFFFEKYKKSCFGPTINNQLISRLMLLVYNSFAEKSVNDEEAFLIKFREVEDPNIALIKSASARYLSGLRIWLSREDLTRKELESQNIDNDSIEKILSGKITKQELKVIAKDLADKYKKGLEEQYASDK